MNRPSIFRRLSESGLQLAEQSSSDVLLPGASQDDPGPDGTHKSSSVFWVCPVVTQDTSPRVLSGTTLYFDKSITHQRSMQMFLQMLFEH